MQLKRSYVRCPQMSCRPNPIKNISNVTSSMKSSQLFSDSIWYFSLCASKVLHVQLIGLITLTVGLLVR
jgi:hypothetical protein